MRRVSIAVESLEEARYFYANLLKPVAEAFMYEIFSDDALTLRTGATKR